MWQKCCMFATKTLMASSTSKVIFIFLFVAAAVFMAVFLLQPSANKTVQIATGEQATRTRNVQNAKEQDTFIPPIDHWETRVTKKPFGIYITPENSPVSPERFAGYHTGTDFETLPDEQEKDVVIRAICSGPLVAKRTASGYGGIAVQRCEFGGDTITVVYGHIKLISIATKVNDILHAGGTIGVLGRGESSETDGERKHQHLGIHKGEGINILGYVQKSEELSDWIDVVKYFY